MAKGPQVGETAPDFELPGTNGTFRRAAFIIDEQGVVRHRHVHTLGVDFEGADDLAAALAALPATAASA